MSDSSTDALPEVVVTADFFTAPGRFLAAARDRHGSLFRLVGPQERSVLCAVGTEAHKALLVQQHASLSNGAGWTRMNRGRSTLGDGLLFLDGPEHRWFRDALMPAFTPAAVAGNIPEIDATVRDWLASWPRDGVIDLYGEVYRTMFRLTAAILLGVRDEKILGPLSVIFDELTAAKLTADRQAAFHPDSLRSRTRRVLGETIRRRLSEPGDDALSRVVRAGMPDGRPVSEEEVLSHANTLLFAGHFTTAGFAAYLLLMLATHPDYLARVVEEQAALDDGLDHGVLSRMTALGNAMLETERLFPPLAHLPRVVKREIMFDGHRIPEGELLFCSVAAAHMDPDTFFEPERFDPDRFAPPRSEHRRNTFALAGFNLGPRRCIGVTLAQAMIKVIVTRILQDFEIKPEPGALAPPVLFPILRPRGEMPFRIRARERP